MSLKSHAYARLCRLYRSVVQRMRVFEWLAGRGVERDQYFRQSQRSAKTSNATFEALEPRMLFNVAPVGVDDAASVNENTAIVIDAVANDTDADSDPLSISAVDSTSSEGGTVAIQDGELLYTPAADFYGQDSFTYTVSDGTDTDTATVTVDVAIVGVEDSILYGQLTDMHTTANAPDYYLTGPANGTIVIQSNGSYVYTPDDNFSGTDSFTYQNTSSETITHTIVIEARNDVPEVTNSTLEFTGSQGSTISGTLTATDADGDMLSFSVVDNPGSGTLALNPTTGGFTFTPESGWTGVEEFTFSVSDGTETVTEVARLIGYPSDGTPVGASLLLQGYSEATLSGQLLGYDSASDPLTYAVGTTPTGTLTLNTSTGAFTYVSTTGFTGVDTFTYTVNDGTNTSAEVTVTLHLFPAEGGEEEDVVSSPDASVYDYFGRTIAIDGDWAVIGAHQESTAALYAGAAYVYHFSQSNGWEHHSTLTASDAAIYDYFGCSVDISGSRIVVGAYGEDDGGVGAGAAYVFEYNGTTWTQSQKLMASDSAVLDALGTTVAMDGDVIVLSSPSADAGAINSGAAYVFEHNGSEFEETDKLVVHDAAINDFYGGWCLDISGETVAIGLKNRSYNSGTLYLFEKTASGWNETQQITPNDLAYYDYFSGAISLDGDYLIVGASNADPSGTDSGSAYVYKRGETGWTQMQKLTASDGVAYDLFASQVALDNETIAVSAIQDSGGASGTVLRAGSVYFYRLIDGAWDEVGKYTSSDAKTYDYLGRGLAISGPHMMASVDVGTSTQVFAGQVYDYNSSLAPLAVNDLFATDEDNSVVFNVLANDGSLTGGTLSVTGTDTTGTTGTIVDQGNGQFQYTPVANYNGADSFTYTISDGNGGEATATVSITVNAVNDAPTVSPIASQSVDEDGSVTVDILGSANDIDGDTLSISGITTPGNGSVVDNGNGTVTYSPAANYNGSDSFDVTVSDGNGGTVATTVSVTVNAVNDAPTLTIAPQVVDEDDSVTVDILGSANDVDGDSLSISNISSAVDGSVVDNGDGTVTYTPNANYNGLDGFSVTVSDGNGGTVTEAVDITVNAVNDAPTLSIAPQVVDEDGSVTIDVLGSANDIDGDSLSISSITSASNGSVVDNGNGTVTYTPVANYNGTDNFDVTVSDGNGGIVNYTILIAVNPVNDAPVAADDTVSTTQNTTVALEIDALANDSDLDGDSVGVDDLTQPLHGTVEDQNGFLYYTPDAGYYGSDSFTYTITDNNGGYDTATVNVTVNPLPIAINDTATAYVNYPLELDVLTNDSSLVGGGLSLSMASGDEPDHGTVTIQDGKLIYTPDTDYTGQDDFTYTITDDLGGTATATVDLMVYATTVEEGNLYGRLPGADGLTDPFMDEQDGYDFEGASIPTSWATTTGTGASISLVDNSWETGNQVLSFTNPAGVDCYAKYSQSIDDGPIVTQFQFCITDLSANRLLATQDSASGTYSGSPLWSAAVDTAGRLLIRSGNDSGLVVTSYSGRIVEDQVYTLTVETKLGTSGNGEVSVWLDDGLIDVQTGLDTGTSVIGDFYLGNRYSPTSTTYTSDGVEFDNVRFGIAQFMEDTAPSHGTVMIYANGDYTYTPETDFSGIDSFVFYNSQLGTNVSQYIYVKPHNDTPDVYNFADVHSGGYGTDITGVVYGYEIEGETLAFVLSEPPVHGDLVLNPVTGTFTFTPTTGWSGVNEFTCEVSDGVDSSETTIRLVTYPVNEIPIAMSEFNQGRNGSTIAGQLIGYDKDGGSLTFAEPVGQSITGLTFNSDGSYSFVTSSEGVVTFEYTVSSVANGTSAMQTAVIHVLPAAETEDQLILSPDKSADDRFGISIAIEGDWMVTGAYREDLGAVANTGAAYVYHYNGAEWVYHSTLSVTTPEAGAYQGSSVAISGNRIAVGAYGVDSGGVTNSGCVYVYELNGSDVWEHEATLTVDTPKTNGYVGLRVALDGDTLVTGSYTDDSACLNAGKIYVFEYDGTSWTQTAELTVHNPEQTDYLGYSGIDVSGDTIAVSAYFRDYFTGGVYLFEKTEGGWVETQMIVANDLQYGDYAATSVQIEGDRMVVGAYGEDEGASSGGAVYVYERQNTGWTQIAKLLTSDAGTSDCFGFKVALSGDTIAATSLYDDDAAGNAGAVYLFSLIDGEWVEVGKYNTSDTMTGDSLGYRMALDGQHLMAGADLVSSQTNRDLSGRVYYYDISDRVSTVAPAPTITIWGIESLDTVAEGSPDVPGVYTLDIVTTGPSEGYWIEWGDGGRDYIANPSVFEQKNHTYRVSGNIGSEFVQIIVRGESESNDLPIELVNFTPAPVTGLAATQNFDGEVKLRWNVSDRAGTYTVIRTLADGSGEQSIVATQTTANGIVTCTDTSSLNPLVTYVYTVTAISAGGHLSESADVRIETRAGTPEQVTGLVATASDTVGEIDLDWDDVDAGTFDVYRIYRREAIPGGSSEAQYTFVDEVEASNYIDGENSDAPLKLGVKYEYVVDAIYYNESGPRSALASAVAKLGAIEGIEFAYVDGEEKTGTLTISWDAMDGAEKYEIYKHSSTTRPSTPAHTVMSSATEGVVEFVLEDIDPTESLNYWVVAVDTAWESESFDPVRMGKVGDPVRFGTDVGLTITEDSGEMELKWTLDVDLQTDDLLGYAIYRTGMGGTECVAVVPYDSNSTGEQTYSGLDVITDGWGYRYHIEAVYKKTREVDSPNSSRVSKKVAQPGLVVSSLCTEEDYSKPVWINVSSISGNWELYRDHGSDTPILVGSGSGDADYIDTIEGFWETDQVFTYRLEDVDNPGTTHDEVSLLVRGVDPVSPEMRYYTYMSGQTEYADLSNLVSISNSSGNRLYFYTSNISPSDKSIGTLQEDLTDTEASSLSLYVRSVFGHDNNGTFVIDVAAEANLVKNVDQDFLNTYLMCCPLEQYFDGGTTPTRIINLHSDSMKEDHSFTGFSLDNANDDFPNWSHQITATIPTGIELKRGKNKVTNGVPFTLSGSDTFTYRVNSSVVNENTSLDDAEIKLTGTSSFDHDDDPGTPDIECTHSVSTHVSTYYASLQEGAPQAGNLREMKLTFADGMDTDILARGRFFVDAGEGIRLWDSTAKADSSSVHFGGEQLLDNHGIGGLFYSWDDMGGATSGRTATFYIETLDVTEGTELAIWFDPHPMDAGHVDGAEVIRGETSAMRIQGAADFAESSAPESHPAKITHLPASWPTSETMSVAWDTSEVTLWTYNNTVYTKLAGNGTATGVSIGEELYVTYTLDSQQDSKSEITFTPTSSSTGDPFTLTVYRTDAILTDYSHNDAIEWDGDSTTTSDLTDAEMKSEDHSDELIRLLPVNSFDRNGNGIFDAAEGMDLNKDDGTSPVNDDSDDVHLLGVGQTVENYFEPVKLKIPEGVAFSDLHVWLSMEGGSFCGPNEIAVDQDLDDPENWIYTPPSGDGEFRLWRELDSSETPPSGSVVRTIQQRDAQGDPVAELKKYLLLEPYGNAGFLQDGTPTLSGGSYTGSALTAKLGLGTGNTPTEVTLYLEAITPSDYKLNATIGVADATVGRLLSWTDTLLFSTDPVDLRWNNEVVDSASPVVHPSGAEPSSSLPGNVNLLLNPSLKDSDSIQFEFDTDASGAAIVVNVLDFLTAEGEGNDVDYFGDDLKDIQISSITTSELDSGAAVEQTGLTALTYKPASTPNATDTFSVAVTAPGTGKTRTVEVTVCPTKTALWFKNSVTGEYEEIVRKDSTGTPADYSYTLGELNVSAGETLELYLMSNLPDSTADDVGLSVYCAFTPEAEGAQAETEKIDTLQAKQSNLVPVLPEAAQSNGIRLLDGAVVLAETDLADSHRVPFGLSRIYTDRPERVGQDQRMGTGWSWAIPEVIQAGSTRIIDFGTHSYYFDKISDDTYATERYGASVALSSDGLTLTMSDGMKWDFDESTSLATSLELGDGTNTIEFQYGNEGRLTHVVEKSGTTIHEIYELKYLKMDLGDQVKKELLTSVLHYQLTDGSQTLVDSIEYQYWKDEAGAPFAGLAEDLKEVRYISKQVSSQTGNFEDVVTSRTRYYYSSHVDAETDESQSKLVATVSNHNITNVDNLGTISSIEDIAPWADWCSDYNWGNPEATPAIEPSYIRQKYGMSGSGSVLWETLSTEVLSVTGLDVNDAVRRVTRVEGTVTQKVEVNRSGQVLKRETTDSLLSGVTLTQTWQYDAVGRVLKTSSPNGHDLLPVYKHYAYYSSAEHGENTPLGQLKSVTTSVTADGSNPLSVTKYNSYTKIVGIYKVTETEACDSSGVNGLRTVYNYGSTTDSLFGPDSITEAYGIAGLQVTTSFDYDGYGNVLAQTDSLGVKTVTSTDYAPDLDDDGKLDGRRLIRQIADANAGNTDGESMIETLQLLNGKQIVTTDTKTGVTTTTRTDYLDKVGGGFSTHVRTSVTTNVESELESVTLVDLANRTIYTYTLLYDEFERLSCEVRDTSGRVISQRQYLNPEIVTETSLYANLSGVTQTQIAKDSEASGVNLYYYGTSYTYDAQGRLESTTSAVGETTVKKYGAFGRVLGTYLNSTTAGNELQTTEYYNGGLVKSTKTYNHSSDADDPVTHYTYDEYNRVVRTLAGDGTSFIKTETVYDDFGQVRATKTFGMDDEYSLTDPDQDVNGTPGASTLIEYDSLGRVVKQATVKAEVDIVDGGGVLLGISSSFMDDETIVTEKAYDGLGRVVATKTEAGVVSKTKYDDLGRVTFTYITNADATEFDGETWTLADGLKLTNDTIYEQTENRYNAKGQKYLTVSSQRKEDGTFRVSYTANLYDPEGQLAATANYGTNNPNDAFDSISTFDGTDKLPTASNSNDYSRTMYHYDDLGQVVRTYTPTSTQYNFYDSLGRVYRQSERPAGGETVATDYEYDGMGRKVKNTIKNYDGSENVTLTSYVPTGLLMTKTVTTTSKAAGAPQATTLTIHTSKMTTTGLVLETTEERRDPDPTNNAVDFFVAHEFSYDFMGNQLRDEVDTSQNVMYEVSDVDTELLSSSGHTESIWASTELLTTYDEFGRLETKTSKGPGGTIQNQILYTYDEFGQIENVYSNADDAVNTVLSANGMTRQISYEYDYTIGGKLDKATTKLNSWYSTSMEYEYDSVGRLSYITSDEFGGGKIEEYTYLGYSTLQGRERDQVDYRQDFTFDAFGQINTLKWIEDVNNDGDYTDSVDKARVDFKYNRGGSKPLVKSVLHNHMVPDEQGAVPIETFSYDGRGSVVYYTRQSFLGLKDQVSNLFYDRAGTMTKFEINDEKQETGVKDDFDNEFDAEQYEMRKFDSWNRLVGSRLRDEDLDEGGDYSDYDSGLYEYDAQGRLIRAQLLTGLIYDSNAPLTSGDAELMTVEYVYDAGGQVVAELRTAADGSVEYWQNYRGADGSIVHQVRKDVNTTAHTATNTKLLTSLTDHQSSVVALLSADWSGTSWGDSVLVRRYLYDHLGEVTQLDYKDATNFVLKTFESPAAGLLFAGEWDTLFKGMTATGTARGAQEYANGDLLYHTSSGVYDPSLGKVLTSADLDPWNGMWNEGVYHKIGIAALAIGASVITGGAAAIAIGGLVTSGLVGTVIAGAAAGLIGGATYAAVDNSLTQLRQTGTIDGGQLLGAVADGAKWGALAGGVFAAAGYGISRGIQALKNRFGSAAANSLDEVAYAGPVGVADDLMPYANNIVPKDGFTDVISHATSKNFSVMHNGKWVKLSHRSMAKFIQSKGVQGNIRLISCNAGKSNLAQNLANKLNRIVEAATTKVGVPKNYIANPYLPRGGKWITFKPGGNL